MRIAVSQGRLGFVIDNRFVDVERVTNGRMTIDPQDVYVRWADLKAEAETATVDIDAPSIDDVPLDCPTPATKQIFGVGLNYRDHAAEAGMELPTVPMVFAKFASCLSGPSDVLAIGAETVDWEVELVAVVGRKGWQVPESDAWDYIAGFTVGQDISDREAQFEGGANPQFGLGKSGPGYGPIGPYIVSTDEFRSGQDGRLALDISCRVNADVVQHSNTRELIFTVPQLVAYLSTRVQLEAGDLIFTGTPAGVGFGLDPQRYIKTGDTLSSTIEGIGTLITRTSPTLLGAG